MNAVTKIELAKSPRPVGAVVNWRGKCIGHFAKVERSIACVLFLLSGNEEQRKLPHLAGQKSAALRDKLRTSNFDGAKLCLPLLDAWSNVERERDWIAHGHFDFAQHEELGWVLIARMLVSSNGSFRATSPSIPVSDLKAFEDCLSKVAAKLSSALDEMALNIAGDAPKLRQALYNPSSRSP